MACLSDNTLYDYVEGRLATDERTQVVAHVDGCPRCREVLAQTAAALLVPEELGAGDTLPGEAGVRQTAAVTIASGARLDRYVLLQPLGAGGMGVVYTAYDPRLDRKIALKLLRADVSGKAGVEDLHARLLREAQAMARLSHPNVITVHDVGRYGEQVYVAMELVDGWTLRDWLKASPRGWREVVRVLGRAGRGLAAAHEVGLVHRDFKPDNVLVGRDGSVRVTDFGLSRSTATTTPVPTLPSVRSETATPLPSGVAPDEAMPAEAQQSPLELRLTRTGLLVGTPAYMPPEQMAGEAPDARADVFSFCVTAYEVLYGARPFAGRSLATLREAIEAGKIVEAPRKSEVPARVRRALLPGLRARAEERPATMAALLAELERDPQPRNRRVLALVAVAAVVALWPVAYRRAVQRQNLVCKGAERKLAGVWDDGRREAVRRGFMATGAPGGAAAYEGVARALDGYAAAWAAQHTEACEATRLRGEQTEAVLDLRMHCLDERRQEAQALVTLLASADRKLVERGSEAVMTLPSTASCGNVQALRSLMPEPTGAQQVRQVAAVRSRMAEVSALKAAGRYRQAWTQGEPLLAEARALGYPPLEASVLVSLGELESHLGSVTNAQALLQQAAVAAERARDDAIAARAWTRLAYVVSQQLEQPRDGLLWLDLAQAATERLGGNVALEADQQQFAGQIAASLKKYDEALDHFHRAIALDERAFGPDCRQLTPSLSAIGNVLLEEGRLDEAYEAYARAQKLIEKVLGRDHYRSAYSAQDIAGVRFLQLRFAEALDGYRRAYEIVTRSVGPETHLAANMLSNMGNCQLELGRPNEALQSQRRALATYEASNTDDSFAAATAAAAGEALLVLGHPREAIPLLTRALRQPENQAAADLAQTRFFMAQALWQIGREPARAEALAREALAEYRRAPGMPLYARQRDRVVAELARHGIFAP